MHAFRHNLAQFDHSLFDAESVYQTTHRVIHFIKSLKDLEGENLLFVGHGANLTASIRTLLGYEVGSIRKMVASVMEVSLSSKQLILRSFLY